jgi:hypothetical protein
MPEPENLQFFKTPQVTHAYQNSEATGLCSAELEDYFQEIFFFLEMPRR